MVATNCKNGFTLIEFLIALVIIGFIVAILVGVFSSPLKQAKMDSAVSQVKDGMRQVVDAGQIRASKTTDNDNVWVDTLVAGGYLAAAPAIPAGISGTGAPEWSSENQFYNGGCGANNSGEIGYDVPLLVHVSEEFCKAYNKAQGLPEETIGNCGTGDCAASGGSDPYDSEATAATTYCFKYDTTADEYAVVYLTNSAGSAVCP